MWQKSMSEALKEARDYRDSSDIEELDIEEGKGHLSYDEWLKKEKGIAKGAHGINSDEHAKYSAEWRAYVKGLFDKLPPINAGESNLEEIVGGHGDMTITKDGGVMIIKTRDWQTYKAKGWVKRTNESLDLSATGDTTTSNASQEVEGEELNEGRVMIAVDKKTKKKWQFSGGMKVKHDGKTYDTEGVSMQQVLELSSRQGDIKLGKKDVEAGFASGTFSVVNDGSVYQPWKNDFEPEGEQELSEAWNEKLSKKGLEQYRTMYKSLSKSGIDTKWIKALEKLYDDIVIGGMYSSVSAEREGILKIDGRTKYKNANW